MSGHADEPGYQTVVHTDAVEQTQPRDDPSGFSTRLRIRDPAAGTGLARLLERVPGLRVRESGGGQQGLSMRGADGRQVLVVLDGVPLSSPGTHGVDLSLLDPGHLEQVEVRRGGGSTRFGTDAVGGVLILRTPALRSRARSRASVGYGSFNTLAARVSRSATLRGGRRPLRYLVSGSYRQSDGKFPYVDENRVARVRENNDSRVGQVLLKLNQVLSERWRLGLTDDFSAADRGAPGMSQSSSTTARQSDLRNLTAFKLLRLDTLVRRGELELDLYHRYVRFRFDDPTPPLSRPPVVSHNQCFTVGGGTRLSLPLSRRGAFHGGATLRGTLFHDAQTGDPNRLETDLWISSQTWFLDRHLLLVPAVRLAVATGFDPVVVPRMGLVLRPLRWTGKPWLAAVELAGNVGRSYRYPSFDEMFIRLDGFGPNPDLKPEDALDLDAGLRFRLRWLSLEAAYFRRWIGNLILFAPVSSFLVRADNYPGAAASGVEAAGEIRPGLGLSLRAAYTFTRTWWGEPAMNLPGHPRHRLVTRVGWERRGMGANTRASGWGLECWVGATVESGMFLSRFNTTPEEGRVLLGTGAALSWRQLTLSAEGRNLLDRRDALDTVGFPLEPARFLVALAGRM